MWLLKVVNKGLVLKGQYVVKNGSSTGGKNDTQHLKLKRGRICNVGRFYWPITMRIALNESRIPANIKEQIANTNTRNPAPSSKHQPCSCSQRQPHSWRRAPPPPPCRNLFSAVAAIACRISCPVSAASSYGKGRNGRYEQMTSYFGSCDNSPCHHPHHARTNLKNSRRSKSTDVLAARAKPEAKLSAPSSRLSIGQWGELGPSLPSRGVLFM